MSTRSSLENEISDKQVEELESVVNEPSSLTINEDDIKPTSPEQTSDAPEIDEMHNNQTEEDKEDDDFNNFDEFNDEFIDANDDEFGDFDDFEGNNEFQEDFEEMEEQPPMVEEEAHEELKTPSEAAIYADLLENNPSEMCQFVDHYLERIWGKETSDQSSITFSPIDHETDILNTACSRDLWDKLSRDTVFYNSVTGAAGQFQWTRSETNKAYLNALGVTLSYEDRSPVNAQPMSSPNSASRSPKKRISNIVDGQRMMTVEPDTVQTHTRSASATNGLKVITAKIDENTKEAEQEMELDIDIARAYCELTEETIRVFPNVKLNAMVTELTRLQKQAADYLDNLLDQKEQLKMDAETYNDLISCIVGHAQRLHVQNKDASPAMVSKKKKSSGTFSNMMRRKPTINSQQSVSMGGGVVGVKQQQQQQPQPQGPAPKRTVSSAAHSVSTTDNRRSL
ncbi:MAG: hypothetical protein EXX96DRAFT_556194 [Benjaminiella poitrasii]|nr:MAG: hypothetical protein EXX96DRAFT_556194 [Benjaminiella poitrasii]